MKKLLTIFLLSFIHLTIIRGQTAVSYTAMTTITCPATPVATISPAVTGLTFSQISRGAGVTCGAAGGSISGSGFNGTLAADITASKWYTFSITSDASVSFTLSSLSIVSRVSSATGSPNVSVQYSIGGSSPTTVIGSYTPTASAATYSITPASPIAVAASQTLNIYIIPNTLTASTTTCRVENATAATVTTTPTGLTATLANITQPTGTINQGTSNAVLSGFTVGSTASADFSAVTISTSGTATATDISNLRLFKDNDGNGQINGADAAVSGTGASYAASIPLTITGETGITTARNYLIVADIAGIGTSTPGNTVTASVAAGAFTTTATNNTGSATGSARTIVAPPGTTSLTAGAGTEPLTISSITNTQGAAALNFDFTLLDDGATAATDLVASQISQIVLNAGTGNTVTNWTNVIAGVELSDGTNSTTTATIGASSITFASITNTLGSLGYIADDASKTYTLKIWLKSSLGVLNTSIDGQVFVCRIQTADISVSGSQLATAQDINSGSGNNTIDVTATALAFVQNASSAAINVAMAPTVTISANDANGNRDLGFTGAIDITSTGTLTGSPVSAAAIAGLASFAGLTHTVEGTSLTLNAERTTTLDWDITSAGFDISSPSAATDYFRSKAVGPAAWNIASNWESSTDGSTLWHTATLVPDFNANTITIRSGHTINLSSAITIDQTSVEGNLVIQIGAALTLNNGIGDDLNIAAAGVMQITSTGSYATTFFYNASSNINVASNGKIQIGAGAAVGGTYNSFATAAAATVVWNNAAIFDWNSTSVFGASAATFFPTVAANIVPIFRVSTAPGGSPGGSGATIINGKLEINAAFNWTGAGAKTFRDGIIGTASTDQSTFGQFIISGANAEIGGSGTIALGTNGLSIPAAAVASLSADKTINGSTITVAGTLSTGTHQLNGSSAITVTGTLKLGSLSASGAFLGNIPTATVTLTGSTVEFNGAAAQFAEAKTYAGLKINNSNGITALGNITVANALTLSSGTVTLGANNMSAGSVTGGSASNYIITDGAGGLTIKNISSAISFPVANTSGAYTPATISNTGTADDFTVSVAAGTPCNTNALASVNRVWTITEAAAGGSVADITLQWNGAEENASFLRAISAVVHCNAGVVDINGTKGAAAGTNPYTQTIAGISSFSPFGVTSDVSILPVTIEYFKGSKQAGAHLLEWKVNCTNTATASIVLERSKDGRNFSPIYSTLATALRCLQAFNYSDANPVAGIGYYRVKMTDAAGKTNYSSIVAMSSASKGFDLINIAPNPIREGNCKLNISAAQSGNLQIQIADLSGRIVLNKTIALTGGFHAIDLNIQQLAAGIYQLTGISDDGKTKVLSLVKE